MSYVKDLMAVAAEWVKLNPTASGQLKIPRIPLKHEDRSYMDQYERELAAMTDPQKAETMRKAIDRMRSLHAEIDVQTAKIREAEDQAAYHLNQIDVTGLAKYTLDVSKSTALHGRWYLAWAHAGHNVFELGNDFVAAMLLTDPRAIDFEALRAPFPGLLVTIPSGFVTGAEGLPYTKLHLSYVDGSWGLYATDGVHVINTHVAEGQALSWALFENLETVDGVIEDADATAIRSIRQIAFGMLAYVTAVDRAIEERSASSKNPRGDSRKHRDRPHVHDVGRTVQIDPILVKYARAGAREVSLQLKHRFIVRGHYRNQAHGHGFRDRKSLWIMPFWKGPREGAVLVHTYKPTVQSSEVVEDGGAGKVPS